MIEFGIYHTKRQQIKTGIFFLDINKFSKPQGKALTQIRKKKNLRKGRWRRYWKIE